MHYSFTNEQEELRRGARRFLEAQSSSKRVRAAMASAEGYDPAVWARIGKELGWPSLAIPERYGGAGLGQVALSAVMEEMGRALLCAPFFSTVGLAANAILLAGTEAQRLELLPAIAAGETIATLAWAGDHLTTARGRVHGVSPHVIDGMAASLLIVTAESAEGSHLYAVQSSAQGVSRRPLGTMDRTRRLAEVRFDGAEAVRLGDGTPPPLRAILDRACVALAAEQLGGAERCLELAVEYAKVRVQFGRPIGSFQAVKHRCADMLVAVESARSAAYWAACLVDEQNEQSEQNEERAAELPVAASLAKAVCSEAYFACAADCIQIHGGIGITWEHDAHLYFKRARASEALLGDGAFHRERVAQEIGL